jgi:hypothetical protein
MFNGCTNLSDITVNFANWADGNYTNNWVSNVSSTGVFNKPGNLAEINGDSYIPVNWECVNGDNVNDDVPSSPLCIETIAPAEIEIVLEYNNSSSSNDYMNINNESSSSNY